MKLRGESGAVPARMGGARTSGGITGGGGARVSSTYKASVPPASVKVVKPQNPNFNKSVNENAGRITEARKSGNFSKLTGQSVTPSKPAKVIKINSK